jgi:hypothetical protein
VSLCDMCCARDWYKVQLERKVLLRAMCSARDQHKVELERKVPLCDICFFSRSWRFWHINTSDLLGVFYTYRRTVTAFIAFK